MGMPARLGVSAAGLPNLGDQANAVLEELKAGRIIGRAVLTP